MNVVKKRRAQELDDDKNYVYAHSPKKPKGDLASVSPLDSGSIGPAPVTSDLEKLVNVADLSGAPHHIVEQWFNSIAEAILCNHHLVVGSTSPSDGTKSESAYEVLELEFYLWMEGSHRDPFTHGSEEQRISGQWYFHRAPQFSMDSHRNMTSGTMYRSGSRKGLDLTIGRPLSENSVSEADNTASMSRFFPTGGLPELTTTKNGPSNATPLNDIPNPISASKPDIRGGILLRSLRRISDGKVICGPSLLVDEILQSSNSDSIPDLVTSKWNGDINAFRSEGGPTFLCFRPRSDGHESSLPQAVPQNATQDQKGAQSPGALPPTVYSSPRIGLDLSHPGTTVSKDHPRLLFLSKRYRFFTHPELLEKGRPQTFIGILHFCLRNGHTLRATAGKNGGTIDTFFGKSGHSSRPSGSRTGPDGKLRSEVMKIMCVKEATVEKYFTEYFAGLDKGVMKLYIGAAGKGASTSPATYLRMVGALERFLDNVVS